ncbi:MAG: PfkB family carbohydrate kinase [Planctomycetota bacterium]
MEITAVGSVALDTIETPSQKKMADILGGSGSFFACCARYFVPVRLVSVIGADFPDKYIKFFEKRGIDVNGIEKTGERTFRWHGRYYGSMDKRETISVEAQCLENAKPTLPDYYRDSKYVFLGNCSPDLQLHVLKQVKKPKLVLTDTMDLWIGKDLKCLREVLRSTDILLLNDSEAEILSGEPNLLNAAVKISKMGPNIVVIKKGSHGVLLYAHKQFIALPALPIHNVIDTTGAGDSFAGGFAGSLAHSGSLTINSLKKALVYGTIIAQFTITGFGLTSLQKLTKTQINKKYNDYCRMLRIN